VWLNFPPAKDVGSLYFIVKIMVSIKYYIIFCFELYYLNVLLAVSINVKVNNMLVIFMVIGYNISMNMSLSLNVSSSLSLI